MAGEGLPIWRPVATSHNRTVPSSLPLARVLPSGLNATETDDAAGVAGERAADLAAGGHVPQPHRAVVAAAGQGLAVRAERHRADRTGVAGEGCAIWWPVATSHSRTVPSSLPLARVLPSGLNATEQTASVWPVSGLPIGWPVATSHNRTVPSSLPLARVLPSGLNATETTLPVWPVSGLPIWRPVATSHSRTVPSALPLARVLPSGLNATELTAPVWPVRGCADLAAGGHVPQPHRAIDAAAGQGLAVRAERHRARPGRCGR